MARRARLCALTPGSFVRFWHGGVHGVLLCQAESAEAVAAFVAACRYPINRIGVGVGLGEGGRGVGSENTAGAVWGIGRDDYLRKKPSRGRSTPKANCSWA